MGRRNKRENRGRERERVEEEGKEGTRKTERERGERREGELAVSPDSPLFFPEGHPQ